MHFFSYLFGKELYMFRTDILSIIKSLYTVFTAVGVPIAVNTVLRRLMMECKPFRNM